MYEEHETSKKVFFLEERVNALELNLESLRQRMKIVERDYDAMRHHLLEINRKSGKVC